MSLMFLLVASAAWAAPVNGVFTYHQPDGSTLQVRVIGDEFFAEEETLDGRRIIQDPDTKFWCYARLSLDGTTLESTGLIARDLDEPTAKVKRIPEALRLRTPVEHRRRITQANQERLGRDAKGRIILQQTLAEKDLGLAPEAESQMVVGGNTLGSKKGLTLLIRFPDQLGDATITTTQVSNYCNQMSPRYTEFGNNGSIAEYFYEVSNGKLNYSNTVSNYYTAKNNRSYYTDESASGRARELIKEALDALEASGFNFKSVDLDGNSVIDALNCFYAGPCVNAWAKGLWPHASSVSWTSAKTGIKSGAYQITNMGSKLTLGTFCHENGHMLCHFPDVYDYDGDSNGGAGVFCLMNGGGHGMNPCPPNGYLRYKAGWGNAETINASSFGIKSLTAQSNGRLANQFLIYVNPANSQEYYLIENRYKNDRDAGLPTGGIAVWHVDEQGNHNKQNYTHNTTHNNYEVALIQADNQRHFERHVNGGQATDLFYEGGASNEFSDTSDSGPYDNNAHWWNGSNSGLRLTNFSAQGNTMNLTVGRPPVIGITISPSSTTMNAGSQKQFTASITGSTNTAVTWSCTGGSVSSNGLYTAPAAAGTYTVKATSKADTNKSASATVTVVPTVSISINPTSASLPINTTQPFAATVSGSTNTAVTWSCTGGSVSSTGLYTAPSNVGSYIVKATSKADTSKSASATVTVTSITGPTGFTWCAKEGGSFTLPGLSDVAYGANGKFAYKYGLTGTLSFNNATFGDPIPGVLKAGYYKLCTTPPGYTKCANEGQSFTLPALCDVAYGANGKFTYKYGVTGAITFNNATFGDPIPGVVKSGFYKVRPAYVLRAKHSGKVLDVSGVSAADGANIYQWTYTGGANQRWQLQDAGNGYYYLRVQHSGKYLDVAGASTSNGGNVHQWTFTGANNQKWQLQDAGNGYYYLKAVHSGKYLDVAGVSTSDGANVYQWSFTGAGNQQWKLEQAN